MDNRSIKHNIYKLRRDKGLSQEEVANLMDISLTSYRKIEKGTTTLISDRISQLAAALGITEDELLLGNTFNHRQLQQEVKVSQQENQRLTLEINHLKHLLEEKEKQIQLLEHAVADKAEIIRLLGH
ncbi:MAG: helix-turn-helix transcriptional regulator [Bacteroidales bacterium]|nr:helix-turn-helix transcriptional regulator [Bacteroidales bacterium]